MKKLLDRISYTAKGGNKVFALVSRIQESDDEIIGKVKLVDPELGIERLFAYKFFYEYVVKRYLFFKRRLWTRRLLIYDTVGLQIVSSAKAGKITTDLDYSIKENRILCEMLRITALFGVAFYDDDSNEYGDIQRLIKHTDWFVSHKQVWDGLELTLNHDFIADCCDWEMFSKMLCTDCGYLFRI